MCITKWPCWRPTRKIKLWLISGKRLLQFHCNPSSHLLPQNRFLICPALVCFLDNRSWIHFIPHSEAMHTAFIFCVQICSLSLTHKTPKGNRAREKRHKRKVALFTFPGFLFLLGWILSTLESAGLLYPKRCLITLILSLDNWTKEPHICCSENKWDISSNREAVHDPRPHLRPWRYHSHERRRYNIWTHTSLGLCDELPINASAPVNYGGISTMMRWLLCGEELSSGNWFYCN